MEGEPDCTVGIRRYDNRIAKEVDVACDELLLPDARTSGQAGREDKSCSMVVLPQVDNVIHRIPVCGLLTICSQQGGGKPGR